MWRYDPRHCHASEGWHPETNAEVRPLYTGRLLTPIGYNSRLTPAEKMMFAVIYQAYIKTGCELEYKKLWHQLARYFIEQRGALGSCLHQSEEGLWLAYSRWPDKATRDASWPGDKAPNEELPKEIQALITALKACLDQERKLPEICMEVVDDLLTKNNL